MSINIFKNPMKFTNVFGRNSSTFVIRQEAKSVEGFRSEIGDGKVENLVVEVGDDIVVLKGEYKSTNGLFRNTRAKEVYVQIPILGARSHMKAAINTEIVHDTPIIEGRDDEQNIYQYSTINFEVTLYEDTQVPVVCDIKCNNVTFQKELITMETPLIKGRGEFEKELKFPLEYQNKKILDHENELIFEGYEIKDNEIEVYGRNITRIYIENEEEVEEFIFEDEFEHPIPIAGLPTNAKVVLDGKVELASDNLTRSGGFKQTFSFTADAYSNNSFYGVTHFDGGKSWDVMKKKVIVETVLAEGSSQTILNRDIVIDKDVKNIGKTRADAKVTDVRVIHNKVIVSGVVDKQIFFSEEGTNIVREQTVQDSFTHFVHLDGVYPGAHVRANARVEYVNHTVIGKREVKGKIVTDVRQTVVIEIKVLARKFKEIDFVTDAVPISPICHPPHHHPHHPHFKPPKGKVINYTVRSGDSLWKIARRYNTTIEAILALNYIPNPDRIDIGQVIKVPVGH